MHIIFVSGIGTDVGKTVASAILVEHLQADYWKPVQSGFPTDSQHIKQWISNKKTVIHPEAFCFNQPLPPHIAASREHMSISIQSIIDKMPQTSNPYLIVEGAGGIMVPLNQTQWMYQLIQEMKAEVILVSRNYLGSINHSLLTAACCKQHKIPVLGWIFNDHYLDYEKEIVQWTKIKKIISLTNAKEININFIKKMAKQISLHIIH